MIFPLITWASPAPETVTVTTETNALDAYENGFAYDVMRTPDDNGVMLNDMVLIEDDGPGSGVSEKGTYLEELYSGVRARKTFELPDGDAIEAHLVLFMHPKNPDKSKQEPFFAILNGQRFESPPLSWHENMWHWLKVPVDILKKGENTLVVGCDAPKGEGYELYIARADEYDGGGGMQTADGSSALFSAGQFDVDVDEQSGRTRLISIGRNSAKSKDGGKTWVRMKLGSTDDVIGEYSLRINLKRFKPMGTLLSPPIDLWDGLKGHDRIKPDCDVSNLTLYAHGETPQGTAIEWQVRTSGTPDMMSGEWKEFTTVGRGRSVSVDINSDGNRYLQWRAVLTSDNPLKTPVVYEVKVIRSLTFMPPPDNTLYVWKYDNVKQRYSSVKFFYEKWDEPKLEQLKERLKLDDVVRGAATDFEKINRIRYHVSQQWHHGSPRPGYPEWNALDILDRRDRVGKGGMCIQFSIVFIQSLAAYGYQARHINMFSHETVEVYIDELGKWVHIDPESVFDSYEYETVTGMPINCLEQHNYFLTESGLSADNPIDWQAPKAWTKWGNAGMIGIPVPLDFSTFTDWINNPSRPDYPPQHILAGFMRMMPRNDYFSRPYPRPLTQGSCNWPWNGYLNWYDSATPRKLQYSLHTDREIDFYPTLNRVEFSAVHTEREGEIAIDMVTFAPNVDGFEVNIDGNGWQRSPASFIWKLKRSALNTLLMRVRNKLGPKGKASCIEVMYHYKEPFKPRAKDW